MRRTFSAMQCAATPTENSTNPKITCLWRMALMAGWPDRNPLKLITSAHRKLPVLKMCHSLISMCASTVIRSTTRCMLAWCTRRFASRTNDHRSGTSHSPLRSSEEKRACRPKIGKCRQNRTSMIEQLKEILACSPKKGKFHQNRTSMIHSSAGIIKTARRCLDPTKLSFRQPELSSKHSKRTKDRSILSDRLGLSSKSRCNPWTKSRLCHKSNWKAWHRRPLAALCIKMRWRTP